ncbi:DUF1761 domain-containing protein [Candidatus Saccharibacteria bacterium]|jgi:uncharacterized membrane protein|nr:DUF1761 domain-containing protein [Candidatus Saccharibacteria bacterium]
MFNTLNEINWLIILLATVVYFILGAIWFTPLFGKAYDIGTGVKRSSKQKWPAIYYYAPFLSSLAVTTAIGIVMNALNIENLANAVITGLLFGFSLAAISFSNGVTPNMPRPVIFGLVVGGYHLISAIIVSTIVFTLGM